MRKMMKGLMMMTKRRKMRMSLMKMKKMKNQMKMLVCITLLQCCLIVDCET